MLQQKSELSEKDWRNNSNLELVDTWRTCNPETRRYTLRQPTPLSQSCLDYFFVSKDIFPLIKSTTIIPGYRTDHSATLFTFSAVLQSDEKGTGNSGLWVC